MVPPLLNRLSVIDVNRRLHSFTPTHPTTSRKNERGRGHPNLDDERVNETPQGVIPDDLSDASP